MMDYAEGDYRGQSVFPVAVYVIHRLMVSLKYASLSPSEYRYVRLNYI
jgi:hypothetical protein